MKFLISIGYIDKNIFYPIAGGIFSIILKFTITHSECDLPPNPLILALDSSLGMSLSIILLIIYKIKNRNIRNTNKKNNKIKKKNSSKKVYELEYTNVYDEIIYGKFKYILLTSIVDFIQTIVGTFIYFDIKINMWVFDILFLNLFSHFIFRNQLYRHHYISTILIIFIGIIIDIIAGYYIISTENILKILYKIIAEIMYCLIFVINKYTIEQKFSRSYEICFYQGFFCFILFSLLFLVLYILNIYNPIQYFIDLNAKGWIIFFIVMIILFILNILVLITIEKTNVYHVIIIIIIAQLGYHILDLLDSNDKIKSIIIIIGLCLILFMTLIFNEIIEINCCGLEKNTKKNITLRARLDTPINNNNNEDNESSQNSEENDSNSLIQGRVTETSEYKN